MAHDAEPAETVLIVDDEEPVRRTLPAPPFPIGPFPISMMPSASPIRMKAAHCRGEEAGSLRINSSFAARKASAFGFLSAR